MSFMDSVRRLFQGDQSSQNEELSKQPLTAEEMRQDYAGESAALGQVDPGGGTSMGSVLTNAHESPATKQYEDLERQGYTGD